MLDGKMGPMLLHNTAYEVRRLYARAAQEEPNCALNVCNGHILSYLINASILSNHDTCLISPLIYGCGLVSS